MEGGMPHKKLKVSRAENWSSDDRKDLLEAIKIEIKTIEDKNVIGMPSESSVKHGTEYNIHISKSTCCNH